METFVVQPNILGTVKKQLELLELYIVLPLTVSHYKISYSAIIGRGKCWRKVYLKRLVGKYLAKAVLNKTICIYIIKST